MVYCMLGTIYVIKTMSKHPDGLFTDIVGCFAIYWPLCILIEINESRIEYGT